MSLPRQNLAGAIGRVPIRDRSGWRRILAIGFVVGPLVMAGPLARAAEARAQLGELEEPGEMERKPVGEDASERPEPADSNVEPASRPSARAATPA